MWVLWQTNEGVWCVGVQDPDHRAGVRPIKKFDGWLDAVRLINILNGGTGAFDPSTKSLFDGS